MIAVWLKIMQKSEDLSSIFEHLDHWLEIFNSERYDVYIYNENIADLPEKYSRYKVINRVDIVQKQECAEFAELIKTTPNIDDKWRGAAFALLVSYRFLSEYEFQWNIDASDIKLSGDAKHYILMVEQLLSQYNLPVLSSAIYVLVNRQWSFGITYAKTSEFRMIADEALGLNLPPVGWGKNIDNAISVLFDRHYQHLKYTTFLPCDWIKHEGENGLWSQYNYETKKSETNLYNNKTVIGLPSRQVMVIR